MGDVFLPYSIQLIVYHFLLCGILENEVITSLFIYFFGVREKKPKKKKKRQQNYKNFKPSLSSWRREPMWEGSSFQKNQPETVLAPSLARKSAPLASRGTWLSFTDQEEELHDLSFSMASWKMKLLCL